MDEINWISMLLSTITPMLIGAIYYRWSDVYGNSLSAPDNERSLSKVKITLTLIAYTMASFFLSFFLLQFNNTGIEQEGNFDTFLHGVWHGVFVVVTVVIPVVVINGIFQGKSLKSVLINISFWVITLAIMGGIVDAMNHWQNVLTQ